MRLPTSFLPDEDQGVFLTMIQLPSGATQERTQKVLDTVTDYYLHNEKANVESVFTVTASASAARDKTPVWRLSA